MDELIVLQEYIVNKWGTCQGLRRKISNEGIGYFYNDYTKVPVSWDLYSRFVDSNSDLCYCGNCETQIEIHMAYDHNLNEYMERLDIYGPEDIMTVKKIGSFLHYFDLDRAYKVTEILNIGTEIIQDGEYELALKIFHHSYDDSSDWTERGYIIFRS